MDMKQNPTLAPMSLSVLPKEKVWGGTRLADRFPGSLPGGGRIGEVWAAWDGLVVENGPFRGQKLAEVVRGEPTGFLGSRFAGRPPLMPLLAKLLDSRETLSVQVHPDDAYASRREGQPFGKKEMWYVIDSEPGAQLIHGVKRHVTRAEAERAIQAGTFQQMLETVEVAPGDVMMNPPGTIHALGPGLLLYELQQASDLTYRLYDWNRNDPSRELHVQKALDVAHLEPQRVHKIEPVSRQEPGLVRTFLCACAQFAAELLRVEEATVERPGGICFHILTILEGMGSLEWAGMSEGLKLSPGRSVWVPAGAGEYEIRAGDLPLVAIKAYVPDLFQDVISPLRQLGVAEARIWQLRGDAREP